MKTVKASDILAKAHNILKRNHKTTSLGTYLGCCDALKKSIRHFKFSRIYFLSSVTCAAIKAENYLFKQKPFNCEKPPYWFSFPWETPNTKLRLACLKRAEEEARKQGN